MRIALCLSWLLVPCSGARAWDPAVRCTGTEKISAVAESCIENFHYADAAWDCSDRSEAAVREISAMVKRASEAPGKSDQRRAILHSAKVFAEAESRSRSLLARISGNIRELEGYLAHLLLPGNPPRGWSKTGFRDSFCFAFFRGSIERSRRKLQRAAGSLELAARAAADLRLRSTTGAAGLEARSAERNQGRAPGSPARERAEAAAAAPRSGRAKHRSAPARSSTITGSLEAKELDSGLP